VILATGVDGREAAGSAEQGSVHAAGSEPRRINDERESSLSDAERDATGGVERTTATPGVVLSPIFRLN
jgi:hypothetical protein